VDEDRPVYNLVIAKGGLKMSESKPEDLKPLEGKGYLSPEIFGVKIYTLGGFRYGFPEIPMKVFADNFLTRQTGRTVIDRTGLTGVYTFTMTFVGEDVSAADPGDSGSASEPTAPSLFTALQEQLGLKLESSKGPVQVLVIDHAERPSAN
jgi:uncharacterized protein (TIGR03435 family)